MRIPRPALADFARPSSGPIAIPADPPAAPCDPGAGRDAGGRIRGGRRVLWGCGVSVLLGACSPALDWRDVRAGVEATAVGVRLPASTLQAQFPCKPERVERVSALDGLAVPSQMHVCKADGLTWSLTRFWLPDPSRMVPAQQALRDALTRNVQAGPASAGRALEVPGMTPSPAARRALLEGRQNDGRTLRVDTGWIARGPELVQVSVLLGGEADRHDEARDQFFGSVRWGLPHP